MTSERRFDQDLPDLLAQVAQAPAPDYRDLIVQRTARMRQRPAWTFPERWLPMSAVTSRAAAAPRFPLRIVAVAALLLIALIVGARAPRRLAASPARPVRAGPQRPRRICRRRRHLRRRPGDGRRQRPVTGPQTDLRPVFSRRHARRVRAQGGGTCAGRLVVARADGTGSRRRNARAAGEFDSYGRDAQYTFSPDGTRSSVVTKDAGGEVWIAKADGSGVRPLACR